MIISLIVAKSRNNVIGKSGTIPWHLPADLKYFKKVTLGHHIIMGRKTYESIGRPLPGRTNIVVTRNKAYTAEGCVIVNSVEAGLAFARMNEEQEVFIVGGSTLYNEIIPEAEKMYITEVDLLVLDGDTFFPEYDEQMWIESNQYPYVADEVNKFNYTMYIYERRM